MDSYWLIFTVTVVTNVIGQSYLMARYLTIQKLVDDYLLAVPTYFILSPFQK